MPSLRIADGWLFIELPAPQPKYNAITNVKSTFRSQVEIPPPEQKPIAIGSRWLQFPAHLLAIRMWAEGSYRRISICLVLFVGIINVSRFCMFTPFPTACACIIVLKSPAVFHVIVVSIGLPPLKTIPLPTPP